jgi:hypothetical protein
VAWAAPGIGDSGSRASRFPASRDFDPRCARLIVAAIAAVSSGGSGITRRSRRVCLQGWRSAAATFADRAAACVSFLALEPHSLS